MTMKGYDLFQAIPKIQSLESRNFLLIAGPCVVESAEMVNRIAENLFHLTQDLSIPFVFKASYEKANRSRIDSFTTIGIEKSLEIIANVGLKYNIPTITDIHTEEQAELAAKYVDILQIPAFLCRQTSLLVSAAKTGKIVNIKKGQFLSPESMKFSVKKVTDNQNPNAWITDRGTCFGYQDLVVDFRGIKAMHTTGCPVILDCTHALQQPNQPEGVTGGRPDLIETIARAGIAVGYDGLFIETHPEPQKALSDGANMLPLDQMENLLKGLIKIRKAILE
jgi:2-dehydro-3-deoxyphosphooctonate aldolase (KDO 8-P synthase)